MKSIAKTFFSKRKQHDVRRRNCRRRGYGHRRELEDHDVAGEVDAGYLERALFTQVIGRPWRDDVLDVLGLVVSSPTSSRASPVI